MNIRKLMKIFHTHTHTHTHTTIKTAKLIYIIFILTVTLGLFNFLKSAEETVLFLG